VNKLFEEGYKYSLNNLTGLVGAELAESYVQTVQESIDELTKSINRFDGYNTDIEQLKGDVFEYWHAGTFNIDAAIDRTGEKATVGGSKRFASPDILTSWQEFYGLKNYKHGDKSAKAQSESFWEYYNRTQQNISFEEFCNKQGYSNPDDYFNASIYMGQTRVIPTDQIEGAIKWLEKKIAKEQSNRPEQVKRYRETLENLTDRVKSPHGAESVPIDTESTRDIARKAKDGSFDPDNYGISTELIKYEHILREALQAGATAAVLTAILKIAPDITRLIQKLVNSEYISADDLKKMGLECLSSSAQSFIRGSVAASITVSFKAGLAGEVAKAIDPAIIGITTAVAFHTISNAIKMSKERMTPNEFADACMRDIFIAVFAYGGAITIQKFIPIPMIGAMLGNIIGSIVGTFVYSSYTNFFLSFCAETGFSFLGIVEQSYTLPDEVLEDMGLDVIVYDQCNPDVCEPDFCTPDLCEPDICNPDLVLSYVIRRGVIGINRIGFMID